MRVLPVVEAERELVQVCGQVLVGELAVAAASTIPDNGSEFPACIAARMR
jgi:hypothetical protein